MTCRMQIPEVIFLDGLAHKDARGVVMVDLWGKPPPPIVAVQASVSRPYALRGLHYQIPHPQGKVVHCIEGSIFDVALDIRRSSPTYGQHVGLRLSQGQGIWIPPGFAHGFLAGSEGATVVYGVTVPWGGSDSERTLRWNDYALDIRWPWEPVAMSDRDRNAPLLAKAETFP